MAQEKETKALRVFEQPSDAVSFYSDLAQVLATAEEIVLQFYETIPEAPEGGKVDKVRTRLRATVTLSRSHARRIGQLLLKRTRKE